MNRTNALLIAGYLAAIVAANLSVTHWGPQAAIWNAAILIGADLVVRDRLHLAWRSHLKRNMMALILAGSALSYIVNRDSGRIALASCVAFGAAATVDAIVFQIRKDSTWSDRANESNMAGAAADSILFPLVAGFPMSATFVFTLWAAKVAGGYAWTLVLRPKRKPNYCGVPGCKIDHWEPAG